MHKTYGDIEFDNFYDKKEWVIRNPEPHVAIKLKNLFQSIRKAQIAPFRFKDSDEICCDLSWFLQRYPLRISKKDQNRLNRRKRAYIKNINDIESLLSDDYIPKPVFLREGEKARDYQIKGKDVFMKVNRMILGDDLGLGKTVSAIICLLEEKTLPAFVVVQPHLVKHWAEKIAQFTNLSVHITNGNIPYKLPVADVYITRYTAVSSWIDVFLKIPYKTVIFDEIQELRRHESLKYAASRNLANGATRVLGLSATPIYNYGNEIFTIMNIIKPGELGTHEEFSREWCSYYGKSVSDPKALGVYLREKHLMLRRTRAEVGRELPEVNVITHTVDYDTEEVEKSKHLAETLALRVMEGSFVERGQAARHLDMLARQTTGISKAKYVAEYVKFLVASGEPVVLAGWHRDVYEIWERELAILRPVFYTGTESIAQKEKAKKAFIDGDTDVFIISLRSGIGLDGLQNRCKTVVFGELDWSPQVHNQVIGRVDRDGQKEQVTAIYLISDTGSDIPIVDVLGIKMNQSQNIINPMQGIISRYSDDSRIKLLAEQYLKKQHA